MKNIISILLIITYFNVRSQNFEIFNGDTINRKDANSLKQGHWIVFAKDKKSLRPPGYEDNQIIEEGNYKDDNKMGIWKGYHNNGEVKYEINFVNDLPIGIAKFYYKNGILSEEGVRQVNKWVGKYSYYYENGQKAYEFNYAQSGEREGPQVYYHENGNVMFEGNWKNGKESGKLKEFYEDGSLKAELNYDEGKCDDSKTKNYPIDSIKAQPKEEPKDKKVETPVIVKEVKPVVNEEVQIKDIEDIEIFNGTGKFIFNNRNGQKVKEGYFEDGKLKDGKSYIYSADGKVSITYIYKAGKITEKIDISESEKKK